MRPKLDAVCEHGTALDVHCCNCHGGFLFDSDSCVCVFDEVLPMTDPAPPIPAAARPTPIDAKGDKPTTGLTMHVCGGTRAKRCPVDGGEHDMSTVVCTSDGESVACAKCGTTQISIDLMELP